MAINPSIYNLLGDHYGNILIKYLLEDAFYRNQMDVWKIISWVRSVEVYRFCHLINFPPNITFPESYVDQHRANLAAKLYEHLHDHKEQIKLWMIQCEL